VGSDGRTESCVRWESTGAKGRSLSTNLWLSTGYNFGCMIASDTLFDSRGWVFVVKLSLEDIAGNECLNIVAMATNYGTKIAITGFVRTIATRQLVMWGGG